jgi:hypothetical protein
MNPAPNYSEIFAEYAMEPHQQVAPGDGAALLECVSSYIGRYVSASADQLPVLALWSVHTYLISEIDCTPYLAITSAEKQSGKTRLLDVLKTLVREPWLTGQVSPAVLFRTVDKKQPTLLLDESDATFKGDKEYAEALRGILNTGYHRGGVASRCVGKDFETKDFSTFCPKAIASIGKLPGTIADRSMAIRLKRARRGAVKRFRERDVELEAFDLRANIVRFTDSIKAVVAVHRPALPDELSDRQQDATECLVVIADLAGGKWPELARTSLISLCVEAQGDDDSNGVKLLSDIRHVFEEKAVDRIPSADLVDALAEIETSPWCEWCQGKPITAYKMAGLLRPYNIKSKNLRTDGRVPKGYYRHDFEESWGLYLPPVALTPFESATSATLDVSASNIETYDVADPELSGVTVADSKPDKANAINDVADVADSKPPEGYTADLEGPGVTCQACGHHYGTVAGWRYHMTGNRCEGVGHE